MDEIKIGFEYVDIQGKTDSEKLDLLLKIAFANHTALCQHSNVIYGNGDEGLIDACRFYNRSLKGLWALVLFSIVGFAGILYGLLRELK